MKFLILVLALVAGCAPLQTREMRVQWIDLDPQALTQACNPSGKYKPGEIEEGLHGCFEFRFGANCVIYTLPLSARSTEEQYNETAGHELRHCRDGYFHDDPERKRF
mgnify:CR=1 FL=1